MPQASLSQALASLVLASIVLSSCSYTIIENEPPMLEPFYINDSGVTVNLTVIIKFMEVDSIYARYEKEIRNNDTLCNYFLENESCATAGWYVPHGYKDYYYYITGPTGSSTNKPLYFKIEFLSNPKVCLVFDGDAKVGDNDIRYWENYTLIEERSLVRHFYSYTITPELMQQAREEYCQDTEK